MTSARIKLKFIHRMTRDSLLSATLQQGQQLKKYFNLYGKMKTLQIGFSCKTSESPSPSSTLSLSMPKLKFLARECPANVIQFGESFWTLTAICQVKDTLDCNKKQQKNRNIAVDIDSNI